MKNIIPANTFTPLYDEIEDRLRLVINYQDINNRVDFMITRNFILNLISTAEEFRTKYYNNEKTDEQIFNINNNETEKNESISKTDGVNLELLKTKEELLQEVNFTFNVKTKQTIVTFNSKNITTQVSFDSSMMQQTFDVIKSAIPYIRWGISHRF